MNRRCKALERIADHWRCHGISYAIAHGIEDYPENVGRDIDVLIEVNQISYALDLAAEILKDSGYQIAMPPNLFGERILAIDPADWAAAIEVHSLDRISWRNVVFVDRPGPIKLVGPFAVDPWTSFVKRIINPLIAGDADRFAQKSLHMGIDADERAIAAERLVAFAGHATTSRLLKALDSGDLDGLRGVAKSLRYNLMLRRWIAEPIQSLGRWKRALSRRARQLVSPCAPVVMVSGKDERRVKTVLNILEHGPRSIFTKIVIRKAPCLREGIFPAILRWYKDRVDNSRQRLVVYHKVESATKYPQYAVLLQLPEENFSSNERLADELRKQILTIYLRQFIR